VGLRSNGQQVEEVRERAAGSPAIAALLAERLAELLPASVSSSSSTGELANELLELEEPGGGDPSTATTQEMPTLSGQLTAHLLDSGEDWSDDDEDIDEGERDDDDEVTESTQEELFAIDGPSAPTLVGDTPVLPESIQRLLPRRLLDAESAESIWQQRVAQLSPLEQRLGGVLAVLGRQVPASLLAATWSELGEDLDVLNATLEALVHRGILRISVSSRPWLATWRFRDEIALRMLYGSVSVAERALLHRRVARVLERFSPGGRLRQGYAAVAFHYDQGGESERAFKYYVLAARAARRVWAMSEGERLLKRAGRQLEMAGAAHDGVEVVTLQLMLGEVQSQLSRPAEALESFETALELARLRRDSRRECEALLRLCELLGRLGMRQRVLELSGHAISLSQQSRSVGLQVEALQRHAFELYHAGQVEESRAELETALELALAEGDLYLLTRTLEGVGAFLFAVGDYNLAARELTELSNLLRRSSTPGLARA
jgi:tetratricopeptide (TPR) repeat protein